MINLNDNERKTLLALLTETEPDGQMCACFNRLSIEANLDRKKIRLACRSLARKGLSEFWKGLWTEDGDPAGAGYCITNEGIKYANNNLK